MVDPPLKFSREQTDDNQPLMNVLEGWGVTAGDGIWPWIRVGSRRAVPNGSPKRLW